MLSPVSRAPAQRSVSARRQRCASRAQRSGGEATGALQTRDRPKLRVLHLSNSQRSAAPHVCSTLRRGGERLRVSSSRPAAQEGAERRTGARCGSPHRGVPAGHASGRLRGGPAPHARGARPFGAPPRHLRTPDPHLRAPGCPGAVQRVASRTSARNGRGASPGRPSAGLTKSRPQETAPRSACRWSSGRRPQVSGDSNSVREDGILVKNKDGTYKVCSAMHGFAITAPAAPPHVDRLGLRRRPPHDCFGPPSRRGRIIS